MRTPPHVLDYYAELEIDEQALTGRLPDEFHGRPPAQPSLPNGYAKDGK